MARVIVSYDTPSKSYIGYREGVPDVQASVTDVDVDARAEQEQRNAFEEGENAAAVRWANEYHPNQPEYARGTFGFTAPSSQQVRERIAGELLGELLPEEPARATRRPRPE